MKHSSAKYRPIASPPVDSPPLTQYNIEMKVTIIFTIALLISGCQTIGAGLSYLGRGSSTHWVMPAGHTIEDFNADESRCTRWAIGAGYGEKMNSYDYCMIQAGYGTEYD